MKVLLEHGLGLDGFELGLEVLETGRVAAAVGAAAGVGQVEALVLDLFAVDAPGERERRCQSWFCFLLSCLGLRALGLG